MNLDIISFLLQHSSVGNNPIPEELREKITHSCFSYSIVKPYFYPELPTEFELTEGMDL